MISIFTGVFVSTPALGGGARTPEGITMEQLGLFTAILMRWPRLLSDILEEPALFDYIISENTENTIVAKWVEDRELRQAITFGPSYSLSKSKSCAFVDDYAECVFRIVNRSGTEIAENTLDRWPRKDRS
jgi:hypothetical protein